MTSDVAPLRRVIVLTPGDEMRRVTILASEDHPSLGNDAMQPSAISQHQPLIQLMRDQGMRR